MKVLIADDERISRVILKRFMKSCQDMALEIVEAADGYEALEKAREEEVDVAILDIEMPGMDGLEAARHIKDWKADCQVVFLTAFADFKYAREAVSLGASEYLVKPIAPEELWSMLEKCRKVLGAEKRSRSVPDDTAHIRYPTSAPAAVPHTGRAAMILTQVKAYMELHYMEDLSIENLAEQFGISVNHLNRILQGSLGMSGKEYLIHIRVEQAKESLKDPAFTIREVGIMAGYTDPNYFARIFKKKTGMTPVEYRNQLIFGS